MRFFRTLLKNAFTQSAAGNQPFEVHGKSLDDRRMPKQDPYLDVSHPSSFSEIRRSDAVCGELLILPESAIRHTHAKASPQRHARGDGNAVTGRAAGRSPEFPQFHLYSQHHSPSARPIADHKHAGGRGELRIARSRSSVRTAAL